MSGMKKQAVFQRFLKTALVGTTFAFSSLPVKAQVRTPDLSDLTITQNDNQTVLLSKKGNLMIEFYDSSNIGSVESVVDIYRNDSDPNRDPPKDTLECLAWRNFPKPAQGITYATKETQPDFDKFNTGRSLNDPDFVKPDTSKSVDPAPYAQAAAALEQYVHHQIGLDALKQELAPALLDCSKQLIS